MKAALLACLLAVAALAQPQPPGVGLSPVEPRLHSDGVIVVEVSGSQSKPLSGVLVILRGNAAGERPQQISRHAASDAAGRLRFVDLPNGNYWAEARLAGCSIAPTSVMATQLEGAKAQGQLQLILQRRPVLTGRVFDERGTPLHNAQVQSFRLAGPHGERRLAPVSRASTDDRGVYRMSIPDADPGRYWIMAFHMEASFPRGSAPRPTGVVFAPNSPDLLSAQPADLSFDQPETTLDITLPAAPRTEIAAGILSGPDGRPCTRCRYSLQRVEGLFSYELTGGNTGRAAGFDTRGVPPGQYRILVEDQGSSQGWWAIEEAALAEDRTTGLTIYTKPPVAVSGRIVLEELPTEAREQVREKADAVVVRAEHAGNHFFSMRDGSIGRAELPLEESEFTLGVMPPEKFRLEVALQGAECYLAGVTRQGRELTSPVLDFSQAGAWTDLEIRVRFDLARPQFRLAASAAAVAPGAAGSDYRLLLTPHPEQNPFGRHSEGHCVADGSCYVGALPPGRYWVIAFHARNQLGRDLRNSDLREKLDPWGREITLAAGETATINLSAAPDKAFSGLE